ncbi:hypothetical protein AX15_003905 [Amanita polypyramis BW_CC]|nr:hypothetical protein AX15_003905 [Amanita polypyramis BW_CC]
MPRRKARPSRTSAPPPPPVQDDDGEDDHLVDVLLAQLDDKEKSPSATPQQPVSSQPPADPQRQGARSRFLARQARRAAVLAQASPQVDPATQERLQRETDEEEEVIRHTCDQLGLDIFHARLPLRMPCAPAYITLQINSDGHCLFSAVADQLSLLGIIPDSQSTYITIRRAAADYIQSHPDDFIPFLPSASEDVMSQSEFIQYCASIRDTAEWGGEPEILALSRAYNIPIHVVQGKSPSTVIHTPEGANISASDKSIVFISYHRKMYGLGEHYNSLRRKRPG